MKTPKTDAGARTVDLPPGLASKLWELGADKIGPMFHTMTGRRLSDRNLTRVLAAARERAGVPGVSHHSFRHTHGSILLDEGWSIAEVADRLGHANPMITAAVYSHRMRDRRRELSFLDELGGEHVAEDIFGGGGQGSVPSTIQRQPQLDGQGDGQALP